MFLFPSSLKPLVAPPRGERGLKSLSYDLLYHRYIVAPPRGERGLKFVGQLYPVWVHTMSLPLVGSVD